MKNLNFIPVQEEVSLINFSPVNFLRGYSSFFSRDSDLFTLEEKLILIVIDRDGCIYSNIKPDPEFLFKLYTCEIYVKAFVVFNNKKRLYSCFLKSFMDLNPNYKPTTYLKNE